MISDPDCKGFLFMLSGYQYETIIRASGNQVSTRAPVRFKMALKVKEHDMLPVKNEKDRVSGRLRMRMRRLRKEKLQVWAGLRAKTKSGLVKDQLKWNRKKGHVVSSASYFRGKWSLWIVSCAIARHQYGCLGSTKKGSPLHNKAQTILYNLKKEVDLLF